MLPCIFVMITEHWQDQQLLPPLLCLFYTEAVGPCSAGEGTALPALHSPLTLNSPLFVNSPALSAPQQKVETDQKNNSLRVSVFLDLDDDTVHWENRTFCLTSSNTFLWKSSDAPCQTQARYQSKQTLGLNWYILVLSGNQKHPDRIVWDAFFNNVYL